MDNIYLLGSNLKLYKFTERYITPEYIGWLNDSETNRFLDVGRIPVVREEVFAPKDDKNLMFAVMEEGSSNYIGTCSLHKIDWISRKAQIGYMMGSKKHWGKGLATELIGLLTDYGFNRLGLNKITAGVVDGNVGSVKVLEKNGYTKYGTNPQDYYLEGEYLDTHLFYKLRG